MNKSTKNRFAIAGFIIGFISLIPYLELFGILGIVFSSLGIKSEKRRFAIAGLILNIISLVLIIIGIIWIMIKGINLNITLN